jgi:hypothetical protein
MTISLVFLAPDPINARRWPVATAWAWPASAIYRPSGRVSVSSECVVADAVTIEPVPASKFAANREKNREFFKFLPIFRIRTPHNPNSTIEQG